MNRIFAAREQNDIQAIMRWCSFLTCTLLIVVPLAMTIPTWVLFYYDIMWCALTFLSVYDAAISEVIVVRYINPQIAQIRMLMTYIAFLAEPHEKIVIEEESSDDGEEGEEREDRHE